MTAGNATWVRPGRILVAIAFALLAASGTLVACGGGESSKTSTERSTTTTSTDALGPALIRVAAASDLKFAMDDLVAAFGKTQPDVKVEVSYGSSGNFYNQITNGAPFDIYFSADIEYPNKLLEAGLAVPDSDFLYAIGRIVTWVPEGSDLDVDKGFDMLLDPGVKKISIANPDHAPYGRAAVAALESEGIYDEVVPKLVYGENIAQAAEFIQSGSARTGIIALSLALSPPMKSGSYWEIPEDMYPRLEQGGVILERTEVKEATSAFRDFALSDEGREIFVDYGFILPGEAGGAG